MKLIVFIMLLVVPLSCNGKCLYPIKIHVYLISLNTINIVDVSCDRVPQMPYMQKIEINSKRQIRKLYSVLNNPEHFILDTSFHSINSKALIVFEYHNGNTDSICWSHVNMLRVRNNIYFCDSTIRHEVYQLYRRVKW
jgi:hypothetical protein